MKIRIDLQFGNSSRLTRELVVSMPSRLSNVSFPVPVATSSEEVRSAPQMMGRPKPRLVGKQYTITPELLEAGSWVLSKDENGKTTWVKEW